MAGKLFLVGTPIGNLEDITARAVRTLSEVAFVVCEDTRHSRGLLTHLGLSKPLVSLPAFAEGERSERLLSRVEAGEDCALITDAGSPAISDPGEKLVVEALAKGIEVIPIPGPSAPITALSVSGLPTARFHFLGFLPRSGQERRVLLEEAATLQATIVLFESPNRLQATLLDLLTTLGDRRACVARELTKLHEELVRGSLRQLTERYAETEVKGELVLLIEGRTEATRWSEEEVRRGLQEGLSHGDRLKVVASEVAALSGWSAKDLYRLGLSLKPARGG